MCNRVKWQPASASSAALCICNRVKCKPASASCAALCICNRTHLLDRLDVGLQAFIDKFRFNAKRASLVQSRIKAIERLGHSELIEEDPEYIFRFPAAEPVSPPILGFMDVDFGYPGGPTLFRNLNFGIDMESRFAMVGPNGKSQTPLDPTPFAPLSVAVVLLLSHALFLKRDS